MRNENLWMLVPRRGASRVSYPNVAEAFSDWDSGITLKIVSKEINDFEVSERKINDVPFRGVLQPVPPQKLMIKPEGQRSWKWYTMRSKKYLEVDSILVDNANKTYRVMSNTDWAGAGFFEYELVQGVPT